MNKIFSSTLPTLAAIGLLTAAGPAAADRPDWANKLDATIVGTAVGLSGGLTDYDDNPNDFDILVKAVVATGYIGNPLGTDDYTVFAPIDQAFIDVAEALGGPLSDDNMNGSIEDEAVGVLVAELTVPGIREVLDYHLTEGVRNSRSVTRASQVEMLDGNTITVQDGSVDAIGSSAGFVQTDLRLADGMIHVINAVLLPF
ncbi:MAG: fasciclin domain-containing protein [Lysobacterales bacterium]|jgi:uncharacterized surface protein with fasciclin (FAS1) repeats